jgi:CheY-like chemotaxis protein
MKTIVVDDDQRNRERVSRMLEAVGHVTSGYDTADEAVAILDEPGGGVRLVVTDVQMPGALDGIDLAALLRRARPDLPVIVMSSDPAELRRATRRGLAVPTLQKPIERAGLLAAVAAAEGGPGGPPGAGAGSGPPGDGGRSRSSINGREDFVPPGFADPRPVLERMRAEAAASRHGHVGSEHVALAAIDGPGGLADLARSAGRDPAGLRSALEQCCRRPPAYAEPGLTPRVAVMLSIASQLASRQGTDDIRPEHLIAALLTAPSCAAWGGLTAAGLDLQTVVRTLRKRLADA